MDVTSAAGVISIFTTEKVTELIAGASLGLVFATFLDALKQTNGGSISEFKPIKDLQATLDTLEPMIIDNIGDHNRELNLPNDVVEDLKREMREGVSLVRKLNCRSWKHHARLRYSRRLRAVDENLKGLISELKIQETRDVKEVLKLVRGHDKKLDELLKLVKTQRCHKCEDSEEEDVEETLALTTKQHVRLTRLISMEEVKEEVKVEVKDIELKLELVQAQVDSKDAYNSLQKSDPLIKAYTDLSEAVTEVRQLTSKISYIVSNYEDPLVDLKLLMEYISNPNKLKPISSAVDVELENLKVKMEEGEKLVRMCLTISHNPIKLLKHVVKLAKNRKSIQSMLQSVRVGTNWYALESGESSSL